MGWLITTGAVLSVGLLFAGLILYRKETVTATKLAEYKQDAARRSAAAMPQASGTRATLLKWARKLAPRFAELESLLLPSNMDQRLAWAGKTHELTPRDIFGLQILSIIVGAAFGLYAGLTLSTFDTALLGTLVLGAAATLLPILWVDMAANKRQRRISLDVPDTIEMLATLVEAGLGFDGALQHVTNEVTGPLKQEYQTYLTELEVGVPRAEALLRLASRNRAPELNTLVGALVQGSELGVPIAATLIGQAEAARTQRIQRAKEEGAKIAPKITLITTFILAPAIMCLFAAVLANDLVKAFGPLLNSIGGR